VKTNRKMKGFTIIELVAVIAIILIMAAMIVPKVTGYTQTANNTKYLVDARTIAQAVEIYNAEKTSGLISGETELTSIKTSLMPETGKKYLNSWPNELKIKVTTGYTTVKTDALGTNKYQELLNFIENPGSSN
jgi:type IV pilus assembly protein PilA